MEEFRAGQTFTRTFQSSRISPDYRGTFKMALISGGTVIEVPAISEANGYSAIETFTNTKQWAAGEYRWMFSVTNNTDLYIEQEGLLRVLPSVDSLFNDTRSHNRKVLDALRALLEGKALDDVSKFSISGREMEKMPVQDLMTWEKYYAERVRRENDRLRARQGKRTSSRIVARFSR